MRTILAAWVLGAGLLGTVGAAPPVVTAPERVHGDTGDWLFFTVTTDGKGVEVFPLDPGLRTFPSDKLKNANELGFYASKPGAYRVLVYSGGADGPSKPRVVTLVFGTAPTPVPPGPVDPPVPPAPVTSFRVILVFESAATLRPGEGAVLYGKAVEDYLVANCSGGKDGFRRKDKDASTTNDTPTMNALWTAVRAAIKPGTKTPFAAVEVNGKVTLEPLPATPDEAVKLFTKYKEGR